MREVALELARAGTTSLQEVERVLGELLDQRAAPAAVPTSEAVPAIAPAPGPAGGPGVRPVAGFVPAPASAPEHILVVDDDAVSRSLARSLLEKSGFRVTEAGDGAAAMDRVGQSDGFALVILDLDMPRMGGREVLERIRSTTATARLPVVVLTGAESGEVEIELMDRGADDYIRKPIDPMRFVARIKAALRRATG
jgi:CheY-like chemotaxis protein